MYTITKLLKTKNKDLGSFENLEDLKNKMQELFWNFWIWRPYYYTHLQIIQDKMKGDFIIKETYKNILVSPSEDLFIYITN